MSLWLATKDVAEIYGVTDRWIREKAKKGEFRVREVTKRNRKVYLIDITSLPEDKQREYLMKAAADECAVEVMMDTGNDEKKSYTLGELREIYGDKFEKIMLEALKKVEIIEKVKELEHGEKVEEIEKLCKEYNTSLRTVYDWKKKYEEKGLIGLLRKPRQGRGRSVKLCDEAIKFIRGVFLQPIKPKKIHVYRQYLKKAKEEGWEIVSKDTIYREINRIPESMIIMGREGIEEYNKKAMPKATRDLSTLFVNEIWVGDGHKLDVQIYHKGKVIRPMLTGWMDMRTRAIVGWCLSVYSNSQTIGLAFRHAVLPKDNSPIMGLPKQVYIDNGKDYRSKHFAGGLKTNRFDYSLEVKGLLASLGVEARYATPHFPWTKPIERQFRTFTNNLSRYLVGFCGTEIDDRPYNHKEKDIPVIGLTMQQLAEVVEGYINSYNNTVHSALKDTPLNVYTNNIKIRDDMPTPEELDILLMKAENASITPQGIQRFNRLFWSDELIPHIGKKATIRFDPNNVGEIYVYINGELICIAENKELLEMNATEKQVAEWRKKQAKARKELKAEIESYGVTTEDVRRMMLEDYIDDEELLDIVVGKNSKRSKMNKVIRLNRQTHQGKQLKEVKNSKDAAATDFFSKLSEGFFENSNTL